MISATRNAEGEVAWLTDTAGTVPESHIVPIPALPTVLPVKSLPLSATALSKLLLKIISSAALCVSAHALNVYKNTFWSISLALDEWRAQPPLLQACWVMVVRLLLPHVDHEELNA